MLTMNYRYRLYPDAAQEQQLIEWMEICRCAFNYGLREIKDWCHSRKCAVDRCSLEADTIFMEDLDYRVSAKGMLGKHMLDAAFGQFRSIVKYICWKRGKFFAEVDAFGTSQECPNCGVAVKKDLSIRIHNCSNCGYIKDRDIAAGENIRNRGIKLISTSGRLGMETACADDLLGIELKPQSRQVSKSRKGITRKSKERFLEAPTIATLGA
jgi:transposase